MKKFYFLFLFALIASIGNLYAAEVTVTSTFKDKDLTVGVGEPGWVASITANSFESNNNNRGVQFGAAKGAFTLTTKVSFSKVKKVSVLLSSNENGNTVSLKVGDTSVGSVVSIEKKNNYSVEWTAESPQDGIVELSFNDAAKSIYIKSIAITYEDGTSCGVPTFSVEEGTFTEAQTITLTPGEGGAQVFYTINGGTEQPFIEPIKLEEDGTYKIAAYTAGTETLAKSATVTKTYVINLPLEEPYILCEDAAWLTEGANIIFASSVAAGEQKAMSKLQKTNNRGAASVTIGSAFNAGKETVGIVSKDADVAVFTVGISNGHITFYTGDSRDAKNNSVAGYLYAASSKDNLLKTQKNVDDNAEWTVSVAANGAATIKAQGANTNNLMRYNPNNGNPNPMFSCYGSGQKPVYIYLLGKTSSVSSMSAEGVKVFAAEGGVEVVADEAADVAVYTVAGQLVRQARVAEGSTLVNVAPGFYVVRANGTATKVIVR
uniref:chitobiase/beta-hexosaminidase C-terminal domain-containing protein n=1 Tax=Candidatus Limisoma sp. TaxID=3076476 RepID=UPI003FF054ED